MGMIIEEAGSAKELFAKVNIRDFDIILLDISMPDRSGFDILDEIKKTKPDIPVLILTMYPQEQYAIRAFKLGASGFLMKITAADELLMAVRKILKGTKYITASLAESLAEGFDETDKPKYTKLSEREYTVFIKIARGKSIREIAEDLLLSEKTISTYRSRILNKLELKTTAELIRYAFKEELAE
ncbi:MAG TPA: response regulator transcription factor [Bacteroidetes bacterium]|nr:response regulator transcription factor [Bacteroidota bacterium]